MIMIRSKPGAECVETLLAGLPEQTLTYCCKKKDFVFERRCGFFCKTCLLRRLWSPGQHPVGRLWMLLQPQAPYWRNSCWPKITSDMNQSSIHYVFEKYHSCLSFVGDHNWYNFSSVHIDDVVGAEHCCESYKMHLVIFPKATSP